MPERLEAFPFPQSQARHDWDTLLDGSVWRLRHGEDFEAKSKTFIQNARHQAQRRSGKVRTRLLDEEQTVVLQFQGPTS